MTIAIGLLASDGIVVAADTQVTIGDSKTAMGKIGAAVQYRDDVLGSCVVAGAGSVTHMNSCSQTMISTFMRRAEYVGDDLRACLGPSLGPGCKLGQVDAFVLERSPQPLDEHVVHPAALAVHRDADARRQKVSPSVKSTLVNWLPWSLLKISGGPSRSSASCKASTQKLASSVLDRRHRDSTLRLAQSITATRYRKPRCNGIEVTSVHHTWFGRVIGRSRHR